MNGIEQLFGKTLIEVEEFQDSLIFKAETGEIYQMYHSQDCCESVRIEDISGDLRDLIGTPILQAQEAINRKDDKYGDESFTWTFYKIATLNGYVTIRRYGISNGYYSETVDFVRVDNSTFPY